MIIFQSIFPLFLLVFLGYLLSRYQSMDTRTLSNLTIYLLTPALLFTKYIKNPIPLDAIFQIFIFALLLVLSMIGIAVFVSRLLNLDQVARHSFVLSSVLINAGNMGLPFIMFAFGDAGLAIAIIFLMINIVTNATIGVFIAAGANSNPFQAVKHIFLLPAVYMITAGIIVQQLNISLPEFIINPLELLGEAAIPVSIILLGTQLSQTHLNQKLGHTALAGAIRLAVAPIIAFTLTHYLNLTGLTQKVLILQTSMPTAVNAVILATKFQARPDFVSGVVLFSTLASAITLTILLVILA